MAKEKEAKATTEKPVDIDKIKDDNAVQDTIAPAPLVVPSDNEDEKEVKAKDAPKTVNIPLSASNALTPEGGIQVTAPADSVEQVYQTDAYDKQKTKAVNVVKDDYEESGTVSKAKYDALLTTFNEVLSNHTIDDVHKMLYKAKAGIK